MVSNMDLSEFDETHTVMEWSSEVTVSGMIQQVGARLMQGAADKITQQVFACIKAKLEAPVPI
jgi:carbon monoxide dehydrogenase subunit G